MSTMYAQFYAHMPWKELPIFALLLFVTVFAAVVVKTLFFTTRDDLEPLARLPLDADNSLGPDPVRVVASDLAARERNRQS